MITEYNVHRLLFSSILIGIKYNEDQYYDNTYYSQIAGVTTKELGILEAELLEIIDYNLYVKDEEYKKYFEYLTELTKEKRSV